MGALSQNGGPALQIDSLGLPARVLEGRAEGPVTHGLGSAAGIGGGTTTRGQEGGGRSTATRGVRTARKRGAITIYEFPIDTNQFTAKLIEGHAVCSVDAQLITLALFAHPPCFP